MWRPHWFTPSSATSQSRYHEEPYAGHKHAGSDGGWQRWWTGPFAPRFQPPSPRTPLCEKRAPKTSRRAQRRTAVGELQTRAAASGGTPGATVTYILALFQTARLHGGPLGRSPWRPSCDPASSCTSIQINQALFVAGNFPVQLGRSFSSCCCRRRCDAAAHPAVQ